MFEKVLTLCCKCKKEITVEAKYEDRNKKFLCDECTREVKIKYCSDSAGHFKTDNLTWSNFSDEQLDYHVNIFELLWMSETERKQ